MSSEDFAQLIIHKQKAIWGLMPAGDSPSSQAALGKGAA